jgi:hypothetical protein
MTRRSVIMDIEGILGQFEHPTTFPETAVRAAIADKARSIPHLLRVLSQVVSDPTKANEDHQYVAYFFAIFLLAQFREPQAYPLLVRFGRLPSKTLNTLAGDLITEDLDTILASVCGTDFAPIQALIEDPEVDEYVRSAALRAMTKVYLDGRLTRQDLVEYHRHLLHGGLERTESYIWCALIIAAMEIHPGENMAALRQIYEDNLVDTLFTSEGELERAAEGSVDETLMETRRHHGELIVDTIANMSSWPFFNRSRVPHYTPPTEPKQPMVTAPTTPTPKTTAPKIGRNEPCPCGSNKKYKKCCGTTNATSG